MPSNTAMITEPHSNDVLSGRGAGITKHPGNKRWREFIAQNRPEYTSLPRNQRPQIAERIVKEVRALTPPGRFLTKDPHSGLWYDIGDDRAIEKTAQAMRDSKKGPNSKSQSLSPPTSPVRSSHNAPPPLIPSVSTDQFNKAPMVPFPTMVPSAGTTTNTNSTTNLVRPKTIMNRQRTDINQLMEILDDDHVLDKMISKEEQQPQELQEPQEDQEAPLVTKKPSIVTRNNTFDLRLENMDLASSHHGRISSGRDSMFSFTSFGSLMEDEEWEALEESCGMPSSASGSRRVSVMSSANGNGPLRASFRMPNFGGNNDNDHPNQQPIQTTTTTTTLVQQRRISRKSRNQFYADVQCMTMNMDGADQFVEGYGGAIYHRQVTPEFQLQQQQHDDVEMEEAQARPSIRYTKRSDPYNRVFNSSF